MLRAQYHFRDSEYGLLAWDVQRLIALSKHLPIEEIRTDAIAELDENHWYCSEDTMPTPRNIVEHFKLINDADLSYPIILDRNGRVMDGIHRVCKALLLGIKTLPSTRFQEDPEPDYVGRDPESLPYDDDA